MKLNANQRSLEKVTALITRDGVDGPELLLFQHTSAGIQIPAGSIDPGEAPADAALREAAEETGLTGFALAAYLGSAVEPWPPEQQVVTVSTPVYDQPDGLERVWGQIGRGIRVKVNRQSGDYAQITYQEWDQLTEPRYLSLVITGWVRTAVLASAPVRHFYHLTYAAPTPDRWQITVAPEQRVFAPFWASLAALPPIVEPQRPWVNWLLPCFPEIQLTL
jgi:8-oxo-dGTP pyrophosphatase MutT (NUDIX family)